MSDESPFLKNVKKCGVAWITKEIFDFIMLEAEEEVDIFVSRQAILGEFCNVWPSLRICAEPLPGELLRDALHSSLYCTLLLSTLLLLTALLTVHTPLLLLTYSCPALLAEHCRAFLETGFNISKSGERGREVD